MLFKKINYFTLRSKKKLRGRREADPAYYELFKLSTPLSFYILQLFLRNLLFLDCPENGGNRVVRNVDN